MRDWDLERAEFLSQIDVASHFLQLFDGFPDVYVFVKNRAGETLFCSSQLPRNHGFQTLDEMLGKTDQELTPGPLAEKYLADDAEIYRTGKPLPPQLEICIDPIGLPDWYRTCKYPVKNRLGEVIGIMGTFQLASSDIGSDFSLGGLEPARQLLRQDLLRFPEIEQLARSCHYSARHFQRQFLATFGTSPRTYWMKLRIREACQRLTSSSSSIAHISEELGFFDQSSFTKHFRKHTGQTPADYRKHRRIAMRRSSLSGSNIDE